VLLVLFLTSTVAGAVQPFLSSRPYQLDDAARNVLPQQNPKVAPLLKYDPKEASYAYNAGYTPSTSADAPGASGSPRITATLPQDPTKGITITDPVSSVGFKLTPQFGVGQGQRDANQVLYPLTDDHGYLVYTAQITGVKEDVLLPEFQGDTKSYDYKLSVPAGMEARLESDGSIGIYGSDLPLSGNVSTGTANDAQLLDKVRKSSAKTNLAFTLPAPVVKETDKTVSQVKAHFELHGDRLTLTATHLKGASYPLTIDPSVYVETAQKLMRGNNETNIDFDVDDELIQKGKLTGARFNSWTTSLALPASRWNHGTAVAGGYVYVVGGSASTQAAATQTIYWAKFNTTTNAIEAANPGNGVCSGWCTSTAYDLPVALTGMSVVAYNGFLYVMGGVNASNVRSSAVYIAKLGVNGEPSLWSPVSTDPPSSWTYWTTASLNATSGARSYSGAVAYNNRMYILGGQTSGATGGITTVEKADINPTGTLGTWSATGMTVLPSARWGHSVQVYNDRLYLIGGSSGTTLQSSVQYIKINSDGTLVSSWTTTTPFATARMSWGGSMSTIWGGYIYMAGGCTAVNASGYCTTIASDIQLASINADGSLTDWNAILGLTSAREGYGLVAWRNTLYGIGGCTAQNTSTGACTTTATATSYGVLNQDGDASTVSNTVANGTAPCASATWYDCNMPPAGKGASQIGQMSGGVLINNGYLYYIGGCYVATSGSICYNGNNGKASGNFAYVAIASDGTLTRAATCAGTGQAYVGSWCVDSSNTVNTTDGLAGFGYSIFNNVIYVIGGTTGTAWQTNVWRATTATNGSLSTWTAQTFTNLNLGASRGYMYSFTRANPSAASSYPGNLYVLGGCSGAQTLSNGLDCGGILYGDVYKCNIKTDGSLEELDGSDCTTTGQLQLDAEPGTAGTQGLGVMAGTVYANYIYLIGGQSINESQRGEIMYAKIDNSNNIVATSGSIWITSGNSISPVRVRGVAFGYNGYLYALAGYNSSGTLNDLLYAKVNVSDGSIGAFSTSSVTVNSRWDLRAAVNNGYVYTIGGCSAGTPPLNCTTMTPVIQTFQLYNNYSGSPAAYTSQTNLFTTDRIGASTAILNGYMYVAGGCTSATDCTTATANVMYAALNPDGSVGTWSNTTAASLPAVRAYGKLLAVGGTLYYVGGQSSTSTDIRTEVYYGTPSSGNVASWNTASNGLPSGRTQYGAAVWNNRIYVTGGLDTTPAVQTTIYASPSLASGGDIGSAWTTTGMTAFNVARSGNTTIAYAGNLYILGGYDGANYLNDVQYAQIASNGTIGAWSYTSSLPQRIRQADGYAANGFMYLFGGRSADTTCTANTYVAPISANTTIASGNNPTGVGEWYQTNSTFSGSRYGVAVAQNDGRAYVIGGGCGATLTYTGANRVASSAMQSQPQVAKYSRMIDTDTDVFPTKWLLNGLDNDIGARWLVRYRSSTNTTAAWGQETNFGAVTLGTPNTYTAVDSSGTNTNFARYYYLTMSIDSSQAFGYPEDVTRGPTIADLTLFFTSDPSKRLRHGATFTGGELQPLDTPF